MILQPVTTQGELDNFCEVCGIPRPYATICKNPGCPANTGGLERGIADLFRDISDHQDEVVAICKSYAADRLRELAKQVDKIDGENDQGKYYDNSPEGNLQRLGFTAAILKVSYCLQHALDGLGTDINVGSKEGGK